MVLGTILYTRGYRFNLKEKKITSIGILSVSSSPNAAKIFINGDFKGVTNQNLQLPYGEYSIEVKKDGYTTWKKKLKIKGELVYTINAYLYPINPNLAPVTNLGIIKAISLDQTEKILLFVDNNDPEKDGIYIFDAGKKYLSLFPPLKKIILKQEIPLENYLFEKTEVIFSPDFKEAIFQFKNENDEELVSYLINLDSDNANNSLTDVTNSKEILIESYQKEKEKEIKKILETTFSKDFIKTASNSFEIINYSPDKTKILYQAKDNLELPIIISPPLPATNQTEEQRNLKKDSFYIYDKKEDKNYPLTIKINKDNPPQWHPNSRQLIFYEDKKISIIDFDGDNKQTLYAGPFENDFFVVSGDNKIILLINFNKEVNPNPDLYMINLQ